MAGMESFETQAAGTTRSGEFDLGLPSARRRGVIMRLLLMSCAGVVLVWLTSLFVSFGIYWPRARGHLMAVVEPGVLDFAVIKGTSSDGLLVLALMADEYRSL